jgi:hypothetical protein
MSYVITNTYKPTKQNVGRFADFLQSLNFSDISSLYTDATEAEFLDVQNRIVTLWKDAQTPGNTLGISGFISYEIDETQLPEARTSTLTFQDRTAYSAWHEWWIEHHIDGVMIDLSTEVTDFDIAAHFTDLGTDYGAPTLALFLMAHFHVTSGGVVTNTHATT